MNILYTTILASSALFSIPPGADLEKLYWDCDYRSAHEFMSMDEGAECVFISEVLKKERFDGSFHRFMDWWRANRDREYAKRKATRR